MNLNVSPLSLPTFTAVGRRPASSVANPTVDRFEAGRTSEPSFPSRAQMLALVHGPAPQSPYALNAGAQASPKLPVIAMSAQQLAASKQELFLLLEKIHGDGQRQLPLADVQRLSQLTSQLVKVPGALTADEVNRVLNLLRKDNRFVYEADGKFRLGSTDTALIGLLARASTDHPDRAVRQQALVGLAAVLPPEQRTRLLRQLGSPDLEKQAAQAGGYLGQVVAEAMPEGPLPAKSAEAMQKLVQSKFGQFLKICDDPEALNRQIGMLPSGPQRDMLLSQPVDTRSDLRTLKHAIVALHMEGEEGKTINKERAQGLIQNMLHSPRIIAILQLIHQDSAQITGTGRQAAEHRKYLSSEPFLNKVQMLGSPYEPGLNARQVTLILDNVSRVVAGSGQPQASQQMAQELFGEVLQSLERRGVRTISASPQDVAQLRTEVQARLKDPSTSEEERITLLEVLPVLGDIKDVAVESYKLYKLFKVLHQAPKNAAKVAGVAGSAANSSMGGLIFKCLGPVGAAWGVVSGLKEMQTEIGEGNAAGAQLKLLAAGVGAGAAAFGALACICTGPPGWIAGSLTLIAAGLGLTSLFFESDPFKDTCVRHGLFK